MSAEALRKLLDDWAVPPPELVGKLPRAGIQLDYLGHAEVTRALIESDPAWTWEPFAVDELGLPAYSISDKTASLWLKLTVHGVTRPGVGTAPASKDDVLKELVSDGLRNAAMRFGIALSLWSKQEWAETEYTVAQAKGRVLEELKTGMPLDRAKATASQLWDEHGPEGDGPFHDADLRPVLKRVDEVLP